MWKSLRRINAVLVENTRNAYGCSRIACPGGNAAGTFYVFLAPSPAFQEKKGAREVVGHGCNGTAVYKDDSHFPFPAIRFRENDACICCLREREMGDWKMMNCDEKKALYRASFCQTFSEFQHPTGQWKFILGGLFFTTSFAFWCTMFTHYFVNEPLPESLSQERQEAGLRQILETMTNPIDGISSKWDYPNDRWK